MKPLGFLRSLKDRFNCLTRLCEFSSFCRFFRWANIETCLAGNLFGMAYLLIEKFDELKSKVGGMENKEVSNYSVDCSSRFKKLILLFGILDQFCFSLTLEVSKI